MQKVSLDRRSQIKWTLTLFAFSGTLLVLTLALVLVVLLLPTQSNSMGLLFLLAFGGGFAWWMLSTRNRLLSGDRQAWSNATVIAAICAPSIALPFAILSLRELLDQKNQIAYYAESDEPRPISIPTLSSRRSMVLAIVAGLAVILIGAKIALLYRSSFGTRHVTQRSDYKVDESLSVPQLYKAGAECNSSGDMNCATAIFKRILALDPSDLSALANLGMSESMAGAHAEAVRHFEMYFAQGGQAVDAMFYMAKSLDAQGDKAGAVVLCDRAIAASSQLIDVVEFKTRLMLQLGRLDGAARFIDGYVVKYPEAKPYLESLRKQIELRRTGKNSAST